MENCKCGVKEGTYYTAFGLTMAGISSKASGKVENRFKYNDGTELTTDLDLNWYETDFRSYDAQIGRFFTQDRFAELYYSWNPYHYTVNNPVNFTDENGDYVTIDKKDKDGNVMLSLLYDGGKAYFYSKDKDGNVIKGDAWDGKDEFIQQSVTDLNDISSTKQGKTVVSDLQSSKSAYSISEASGLLKSQTDYDPNSKGGAKIDYYQKGGSHESAATNKSSVVLGHELYHAWSHEFGDSKGASRLYREKGAVRFENYLRASFGETDMRTHYRLAGGNERVANSSVSEALNLQLRGNYLKTIPAFSNGRRLQRDVDNTFQRQPFIPLKTIDTRVQKM